MFKKLNLSYLLISLLLMISWNMITKARIDSNPFYAYYTKINSGEIFEKYSRTGPYSDIVVQLDIGQLIFHRSSSYLPVWKTDQGEWYLDEIIPRKGDGSGKMPDRTNSLSYVRIISQCKDEIVIHWRYEPSF
ncbi:MAG: hypothetical protein R3250_12725, partial [Melioribacteraceae bacterium]|nr:hypothetical protein [Melioribacteraceae bacterium]